MRPYLPHIADTRPPLMITRLLDGIARYESQPYEIVAGWALVAWAVAGLLGTPDYALLTAQGIGHAPAWVWMAVCACLGAAQLLSVRSRREPARHLCAALSGIVWAAMWLGLYWGHGAVTALALIPVLFVCDLVAFVRTEAPRLPLIPRGTDERAGRGTEGGR